LRAGGRDGGCEHKDGGKRELQECSCEGLGMTIRYEALPRANGMKIEQAGMRLPGLLNYICLLPCCGAGTGL
jgi:hypothetical protein